MKRTGFNRRRRPLARRVRIARRRLTPRRTAEGRVRDEVYKAAVRALPCYAGRFFGGGCGTGAFGVIDPDHQGEDRGAGLKASDDTCVPMCRKHHDERQFMHGAFKDWTKELMRAWCREAVAATQLEIAGCAASKERIP